MSKSLTTVVMMCGGLLMIPLSGCNTTATPKPVVQHAVSGQGGGKVYVIRQAAMRTPGTERLQPPQSRRQAAVARVSQPAAKRAAKNAATVRQAKQSAEQQRVAGILQQQAQQRAGYHARYQARLAAKKQQQQRYKQAQQHRQKRSTQATTKQASHPSARRTIQPSQQTKQPNTPQLAANATEAAKRQFYLARWERQQAEKRLEAKQAEIRVEQVINNAQQQIGSKYVWGGSSPKTGFDCSGLVQHAIKKGANVQVPRTAAEQYRAAVKVPAQQASRGDLVFFKTRGNSVSHVGIYLGDNRFIHAPRTGRKITKSTLSGYWQQRFVGFGRIPGACKLPV